MYKTGRNWAAVKVLSSLLGQRFQEDFIAMNVHQPSLLMIHFNEVEQWCKLAKSALKSLHVLMLVLK